MIHKKNQKFFNHIKGNNKMREIALNFFSFAIFFSSYLRRVVVAVP